MGFKLRTYKLVFDNPDLEGLEVRLRGLTIGQLARLSYILQSDKLVDPDDGSVREELYSVLAAGLVSWNIEDDSGQTLPGTTESVSGLPSDLVIDIVSAWEKAVAAVAAPLGPSLNSGKQYPEVSLPMEVLSPNLSS